MAITYASNVFSVSGANDEATLKAVVDANPTIAWYEGGACTFRFASLNFTSGSSLTIRDGTNLVFGGTAGYRINGVDSVLPILDFQNGGGIVYNGNVQHSFFRMDLRGNNITYRINANTVGGRGDFFVGGAGYGVMTGSMKNLTLVFGNGASNVEMYLHLELLAGKINGLNIINDLRTTGPRVYIQFGNGTYQSTTLPSAVSTYGITAVLSIALARSGGNSRLVSPKIPNNTLTINGDTFGTAELVNEIWPDLAAGTVGTIAANPVANTNNTAVSRKITWTPGTYFTGGWNVDLRDSKATPTVYKNGLMTAATDIEMTWALYNRNPSAQTAYTPFKLVARKRGYLEQVKSFSPVQPVVESFVPVVDTYYTSDQSALGGISAVASTQKITTTSAFTGTVDQINDWFDWWLEQPAQLASVSATPKTNSGTTMTITGWTLENAGTINVGAKLKAMTFSTVTNTGTINGTFTDSTGTRVSLTNRNGVIMTSYVLINGTAVGGATVGGTFIPGFVPLVMSRTLTVLPTDTVRMVVNAYGYKPQVINCTGADLDAFTVTLEIESGVDVTSVSTVTRDAVADIINFSQASPTQIDITLLQTLAAYFPKDCVAGVAYAFVTKGYLAFAAMAQANNANIYSLSNGQMVTYFPGFKLRMNDTAVGGAAIVPTATGYSIPLVAYYFDSSTGTASPVTILNASNAKIETAPWTQATATLSEQDKASIASKVDASTVLAKEATLATRASQSSVNGLSTLAQIEASTVLAKKADVTAVVGNVWTAPTRTLTSSAGATLAEIEGSTVLAKEVTVASRASQSSVNNVPQAVWAAETRTLQKNVIVSTGWTVKENVFAGDSLMEILGAPMLWAPTAQTLSIKNPNTGLIYVTPAVLFLSWTEDELLPAGGYHTLVFDAALAQDAQAGSELVTTGVGDYVATASELALVKSAVDTNPTLAEIEASTVLAKEATTTAIKAKTDTITQAPSAADIAAHVEAAILADGDGKAVLQAIADKIGNTNLSAAVVALAVRTELTPELDRIDTAVSTRSPTGGVVDANIVKVNNVPVDGTGSESDPWGPV